MGSNQPYKCAPPGPGTVQTQLPRPGDVEGFTGFEKNRCKRPTHLRTFPAANLIFKPSGGGPLSGEDSPGLLTVSDVTEVGLPNGGDRGPAMDPLLNIPPRSIAKPRGALFGLPISSFGLPQVSDELLKVRVGLFNALLGLLDPVPPHELDSEPLGLDSPPLGLFGGKRGLASLGLEPRALGLLDLISLGLSKSSSSTSSEKSYTEGSGFGMESFSLFSLTGLSGLTSVFTSFFSSSSCCT